MMTARRWGRGVKSPPPACFTRSLRSSPPAHPASSRIAIASLKRSLIQPCRVFLAVLRQQDNAIRIEALILQRVHTGNRLTLGDVAHGDRAVTNARELQ